MNSDFRLKESETLGLNWFKIDKKGKSRQIKSRQISSLKDWKMVTGLKIRNKFG